MNLVSIVPPPTEPGRPTLTQGTEVILADGSKMDGVTGITIRADCNGVWQATIECHVNLKAALDGIEVVDLPTEHPITLQAQCRMSDEDLTRISEFAEKAYPGRKVVILPHDVKVVQPVTVNNAISARDIEAIAKAVREGIDWHKCSRLYRTR